MSSTVCHTAVASKGRLCYTFHIQGRESISSNFLPDFLFTKHLFLDINQTSSLLQKWQFRDEVRCFSEQIRLSTFPAGNRRKQKEKSLESEDSRLLELLGRFELPTSSLPRRSGGRAPQRPPASALNPKGFSVFLLIAEGSFSPETDRFLFQQ